MSYGNGTPSEFRYRFGGLSIFGSPIGKDGFMAFVHVARAAGQHGQSSPENPGSKVSTPAMRQIESTRVLTCSNVTWQSNKVILSWESSIVECRGI